MLATGYISIFPIALNLMPWNAEHGLTKVPAYTQPTELFSFDYNKLGRTTRKPVKRVGIEIYDIPAHLCSDTTVETLLSKLCHIKEITFDRASSTYWVTAMTYCLETIPPTAHLGVKKREAAQTFIHIWPIWYDPLMEPPQMISTCRRWQTMSVAD
jgi:hypothetical protein